MRFATLALALAGAAMVSVPAPARAWEAQTTHAGLAEQSAASSALHTHLVELGFPGGLYEALTVPPADAPQLIDALSRYSPIHGYVPDQRGRQYAVAWLVAGAVLADSSAAWAANHFFDPASGAGLRLTPGFADRVAARLHRIELPERGSPAPDWLVSADNPLGLEGFVAQYVKAVRAATPGERGRHLAGALIAAGAMLHVLHDMASPSHVRDDAEAHLDELGPAADDLGSRFERIAALAYGRLGVPAAAAIARPGLRAFFTSPDGAGLADLTSTTWFSPHTLPAATRIAAERGRRRGDIATHLAASLRRPAPAPPGRLNLLAAADDDGTTLTTDDGVCLARYQVERGVLSWSLDDECMLEQVGALLPAAVGHGAGLLDWLFRGELAITRDAAGAKVTTRSAIGAGEIVVLGEDARGVRTELAVQAIAASADGATLATVAVPAGVAKVYTVYRGVDAAGEVLVATGALALETR